MMLRRRMYLDETNQFGKVWRCVHCGLTYAGYNGTQKGHLDMEILIFRERTCPRYSRWDNSQ